MVYFCADDYGISKDCNNRIEECLDNGVLNKTSVLPNGELADFKTRPIYRNAKIALHINLVEGFPLSDPKDIDLLVSKTGTFKYSFIGLFFLSLFGKRRKLEKQLYHEIKKQVAFFKELMGESTVSIDSHQHTHMIPLVFKTLMRVIEDEQLQVECLRYPAEPVSPYILTPSLYLSYSLSGLIKQWLLKFLSLFNRKKLKKSKIKTTYFIGVLFSGSVTEEKINKILPRYLNLAKKHGKAVEIGIHPGYLNEGEEVMDGCRTGFKKFYLSPWRKKEYETLINLKH